MKTKIVNGIEISLDPITNEDQYKAAIANISRLSNEEQSEEVDDAIIELHKLINECIILSEGGVDQPMFASEFIDTVKDFEGTTVAMFGDPDEEHDQTLPFDEMLKKNQEEDHKMSRKKLWCDTVVAYTGASNSKKSELAVKWADRVLAEFDERFKD